MQKKKRISGILKKQRNLLPVSGIKGCEWPYSAIGCVRFASCPISVMKSWASGMDWTNRGRRQSARTHLCHIFHRLHLLHLLIWYTCPPVCAGLSGSNAGGSRRGRSFRYPALAAPAVAVNSSHWHEIAFCDSWEATASNKLRLYYTHTIYIGRLHSGSQRK